LLTQDQLREWEIFFNIEPWGFVERDAQHSFDRYVTAIAGGLKKQGGGQFDADEFSRLSFQRKSIEEKRLGPKALKNKAVDAMKSTLLNLADSQNSK